MGLDSPLIDISAWTEATRVSDSSLGKEQKELAEKFNSAFTEFGFVILIGHGIPDETFQELNFEAKEFFNTSTENKLNFNHGKYGHPFGGYTGVGNETVTLSLGQTESTSEELPKPKKADPVENFVFTSSPDVFKAKDGSKCPISGAQNYFERMTNLLTIIHSISCCALGIDNLNFFEQFYNPKLPGNENMGKNGNCLRLAHYPPQVLTPKSVSPLDSSAENVPEVELRYGAHTDYQGFTLLRPDKSDWTETVIEQTPTHITTLTMGGLEAQSRRSGKWIRVKIPQDMNALVINAGDLLQRWTNNYWHSPVHRVVMPTVTITPIVTATTATATATTTTTTTITSTLATVGIETCENNSNDAYDNDSCSSSDNSTINSNKEDKLSIIIDSALLKPYTTTGRQAIVFFSGPLEESVIEVISLPHILNNEENCTTDDSSGVVGCGYVAYEPIKAGDFLRMKLNKTN